MYEHNLNRQLSEIEIKNCTAFKLFDDFSNTFYLKSNKIDTIKPDNLLISLTNALDKITILKKNTDNLTIYLDLSCLLKNIDNLDALKNISNKIIKYKAIFKINLQHNKINNKIKNNYFIVMIK